MLLARIKELARHIYPEVRQQRRYLHQHPELSFHEFNTCNYIKEVLDKNGIAWTPIADTGILAIITGDLPSDQVIALRADIDALPITELNNVPYKSVQAGVMHACGHDAHTSSLLGVASILQTLKAEFGGVVKLLFQPAEEVFPGGATQMLREGAFENPRPSAIIGQHVTPTLPVGRIALRKGRFMASMDELRITVRGKGGHGAQPHQNIDPVIIAAHIIVALQQVVSRRSNPATPSVLSIGKVIADGSVNVVPDSVYMEGTFRTMNEAWREEAHKLIAKIASGTAETMGGTCNVEIRKGYPSLVNNEALTEQIRVWAGKFLGEENVGDAPLWMAAEDFAYYTEHADSCFYLLGTGNNEKGITSDLHTPTFDIDESALGLSTGLMAYIAIRLLGN